MQGKLKVGITGQAGFIGTYLYNTLGLEPDKYERIAFDDSIFKEENLLRHFVSNCDVIVHLAAMNRHEDQQVIYDTNIALVSKLIRAMDSEKATPHVMFSSSTQEMQNNLYGKSKLKGREMLEQWSKRSGGAFTGLVIPNVYGEFSRPNYNTFIATFANKLIRNETPTVIEDNSVKLIHVGSLCRFIISQFHNEGIVRIEVPHDFERKVTEILSLFEHFHKLYNRQGIIPHITDRNDLNLFNTFRSYITPKAIKLEKHSDSRGIFVETIKLGIGGQVSFSTTASGITRGNHYHTRKIERFIVIKGTALIELRKIGEQKTYSFTLNGSQPAYVDIPVWFTHNIKNIGKEELYTQFWINEWYDPTDGDTYFEEV